ncbi:MAG: hypothetical protein RMK51_06065 [Meiothermus sp.]|uniref:hypothetical protein n=1 Tax=Meiothermus sp. TaxID=1955249 RepID=UPI0025DAA2A5|nr:hypothetical protein [Meiothermus sp.]MCS7068481.1 hypothetical protein [Meiothermus sp.]MDW8425479.1 hypothetical protein [Meiothermus sp.]
MPALQQGVAVVEGIQCEWVPGTMNQVRVHLPGHDVQVSLEQLQQIAGVDAVHELYLKGLISLPLSNKLREAFDKA